MGMSFHRSIRNIKLTLHHCCDSEFLQACLVHASLCAFEQISLLSIEQFDGQFVKVLYCLSYTGD